MTINPDPDLVQELRQKLGTFPGDIHAYASGWLSGKIVNTAARHAEFCDGCRTCDDLTALVSMVSAVQIEDPPPPGILARLWRR